MQQKEADISVLIVFFLCFRQRKCINQFTTKLLRSVKKCKHQTLLRTFCSSYTYTLTCNDDQFKSAKMCHEITSQTQYSAWIPYHMNMVYSPLINRKLWRASEFYVVKNHSPFVVWRHFYQNIVAGFVFYFLNAQRLAQPSEIVY